MPPRKRPPSVFDGDAQKDMTSSPTDAAGTTEPDGALARAEEAEAEAAEAAAQAARARARALKLRLQAKQAGTVRANTTKVDITKADTAEAAEPDESTVGTEDLADDGPARRRRLPFRAPRIRARWAAAALVVLCTLGFSGAGGYLVWHHRQAVADQQHSAEFAAAARQSVVTLMSLNFNTAAVDVKRILDNTTGDFRKDFQVQSEQFAKSAQESKVITEATVNATAVQSMTQDTATVLVAATTNVSNATTKERQPRSWRLRVDIARDDGRLKLANVQFVP